MHYSLLLSKSFMSERWKNRKHYSTAQKNYLTFFKRSRTVLLIWYIDKITGFLSFFCWRWLQWEFRIKIVYLKCIYLIIIGWRWACYRELSRQRLALSAEAARNYFSFILCAIYSLELFSFILCTKTKKRLLLVLKQSFASATTEYQELFVDVTS